MGKLEDIGFDAYGVECVDLDPLSLEEEFIRIAADLAYWNARFAKTTGEYLRAKWHREQVAAALQPRLREELMGAAKGAAQAATEEVEEGKKSKIKVSMKSPTVADIEAAVTGHPEYVGARELEIEREEEKSRVYGIVDAIRTKRDMLVQIGANRRVEMQGDPLLRNEVKGAREARGI